MSGRVYFDHAATSPLRETARAAMLPWLASANASSLHAEGRRARCALDEARSIVARVLGAARREVLFTSGGTEGLASAIFGIARTAHGARRIIASASEHSAVLSSCRALAETGFQTDIVAVDGDGTLEAPALERALEQQAALLCIVLANNETGAVNRVAALAAHARARGCLVLVDAVQGAGLLKLDVDALGADALVLSAHKFGGPQGAGVLYLRAGTPFTAALAGSQEAGLRPGTENVAAIVGCAAALAEADEERPLAAARLTRLRELLESAVAAGIPDVRVNAAGAQGRSPAISSISFAGVDNQALAIALDLRGFAVSTGSACAAGSREPSHVLAAMRAAAWAQKGVIRFSMGHTTRGDDVTSLVSVLPSVIESVRGGVRVEIGD